MPIIGMVKLHQSELSSTNQNRMIDTEARSTAKRCLFERPDHDRLMQQVMKQLEEQQEDDCKRWNFDFRTGKPLPGRYQWMPVSRPTIGIISTPVKRLRLDPCPSADITDMPKLISNNNSCIQTKMTDYMRTRKTSTSSSSSSSKATEDVDPVNPSLGEDVENESQ